MKLINREPTEDMLRIIDCHEDGTYQFSSLKAIWQAMFDAAPSVTVDMEPVFWLYESKHGDGTPTLSEVKWKGAHRAYYEETCLYSATQLAILQAENERLKKCLDEANNRVESMSHSVELLTAERDELLNALRESLALNINWSSETEPDTLAYYSEYKKVIYLGKKAIAKYEGEKHDG